MIPVQVALVDTSGRVSLKDLTEVAGALNEQVHADFHPMWRGLAATVVIPYQGSVPKNTWRVELASELDESGALGYHSDDNKQPYAKILYTRDWTVTASHEVLEMLADPFGSRMHAARLPEGISPEQVGYTSESHRVHYLLEVCDPCEATTYEIGGVEVSDFLTHNWYRTNPPVTSAAYSARGGCTRPRQVSAGGYVSFSTDDGTWYQVFNSNSRLQLKSLGKFNSKYGSLREFTDHHAREYREAASKDR